LLQIKELFSLHLHYTFRDVIFSKSSLEFFPCDVFGILGSTTVVVPPFSSGSNKLVGCQEYPVSSSSMDNVQLLIYLMKLVVGLEGVFALLKVGGLNFINSDNLAS
jgi:hypothetical protein